MKKTVKTITPKSRAAFRRWLSQNHQSENGVWVVIFKASSAKTNLKAADVAEEALCFGWIDSVPRKIDSECYKLRVSPRRKKSVWSALNKKRIKQLIASGQMTAQGMAKLEQAKRDGSWSQLDRSDRLEVPADLQALFSKRQKASAFYESIAPSSKRIILEWIYAAKTPETRNKRIAETVRLAEIGIRANHYLDLKKQRLAKK